MGPSGSGKSTLLDALAGRLLRSTKQEGQVLCGTNLVVIFHCYFLSVVRPFTASGSCSCNSQKNENKQMCNIMLHVSLGSRANPRKNPGQSFRMFHGLGGFTHTDPTWIKQLDRQFAVLSRVSPISKT
jgi:energy-coupling factor transporter ATP-binding protein EcfA2